MKTSFVLNILVSIMLVFQPIAHVQAVTPNFVDTSTFTSTQLGVFSNLGDSSGNPITISSGGDINGDGHEDILVGAYSYLDINSNMAGRGYIIFGTATGIPNVDFDSMTVSQGIKIIGDGPSMIGFMLEGVGDVNGDGIDDVMAGAPNLNAVYVIFGKRTGLTDFYISNFDNSQGAEISTLDFTYLGYSIKNIGDINNDGISDIAISAPAIAVSGNIGIGEVYIIFGQSTGIFPLVYSDLALLGSTGRGFKVTGSQSIAYLGMSAAKAGDVNQDGIADFLIISTGAKCTSGDPMCGAIIVIYGSQNYAMPDIQVATLTLSQGLKIIGGSSSAAIGFPGSANGAGDRNNDGVDDLVLGVPLYTDSSGNENVGMVYIIYGKAGGFSANIDLATFSSSQGYTITGSVAGAAMGISTKSADIDGDGHVDLIIGSPGGNNQLNNNGTVCVIFGGQSDLFNIDYSGQAPPALRMFKFLVNTGIPVSGDFGIYVSTAKDLNGDGINDILFTGLSKAYALYGSKCTSGTQCSSLSPQCYIASGCACGESNLYFEAGKCVTQCSSQGYYVNTPICEKCPASCSTCTSSSNCQVCITGFLNQVGTCVSTCSQGYYQDGTTCQPTPTLPTTPTSPTTTTASLDADPVHPTVLPSDIENINSITNVTDTFDSATLTAASALAPQDPGSVTAGMLTKMLQYIKYLDLPYSDRLELTFKPQNSTYGPFGLGPNLPKKTVVKLPLHPIPLRFLEFNVHSSFLVNFWDSLIFISIILSCFLLFKLIEWSTTKIKGKPVPPPVIRKIRAALQNFFFMQYYNVFGDVLLFLTLNLKTLSFDNADTIISFCLAILFLCIGCLVMTINIYILLKFYTLRKRASWVTRIDGLYKVYEGSEVFFKHFKNKSIATQSFLLVFVIRNILFNLVLVLLTDYALVQTIIILSLTLIMLGYLFVLRPFNTLVNLLQQIICESMFLIVNTCVFIISQLNLDNESSYDTRDKICDVIIYVSLVFTFVPQVFLGIKIIIAIVEWIQTYGKKPQQSNINQLSGIKINKRMQNNVIQSPKYQNQSLNDSTSEFRVYQNSQISMHTNDSFPINLTIRDNSPFQTNNSRRRNLKGKSHISKASFHSTQQD